MYGAKEGFQVGVEPVAGACAIFKLASGAVHRVEGIQMADLGSQERQGSDVLGAAQGHGPGHVAPHVVLF